MPGAPAGFPSRFVGDPVDTLTGALVERKLEFRLIGPLELSWWRHYDSAQAGQRYALGWGHTHEFDRILFFGEDRIIYGQPVGQQTWFPLLARDGEEASADGFTLRRRSATRYELRRHGEPAMEFVLSGGARRVRPARLFHAKGEIRLFHDARNQLERIVHSTGAVLIASRSEDGLLTGLAVERPDGARETLLTYVYDNRGNLVKTADGRGHGYEFRYDDTNRLILRRGRKGFRFRFRYDAEGRCVFSAGDNNWYGVALTYDVPGRLTTVRKPDGGVWTYRFLPGGKLAEVRDPLGGIRKYLYDALGRATHEVDPLGNVTEYVLDAAGAPLRKVLPTGHSVPMPEDLNEPDPMAQRVAANAAEYHFGRLIRVAESRPPTPTELAALALPSTTAALATTRPEADPVAAAETTQVVKPLGIAWWPAPRRGRIFNALGKLVTQVDDAGRVREWTYDASGNRASQRDFDGGMWRYDYGAWHLLLGLTDPNGAQTRFTYTTNERVASCLDPGGTLSEYHYDQADNLAEVKRHGVVRETYARDVAGNLIAKHAADGRLLLRREIGPSNLLKRRVLASGDEHEFFYDAQGHCTRATTKRDAVERRYDPLGQLVAELRNGQGLEYRLAVGGAVEVAWFDRFVTRLVPIGKDGLVLTDPTEGRHSLCCLGHGFALTAFANGTKEVSQFDERGRCLLKDLRRPTGAGWTRRFNWSGEGELRRIDDSLAGEIRHDYDAAHRLSTRTVGGQTETYMQDLADNLLAQPGLSGARLRDGNRLAEANGMRFDYDDRNHIARCEGPDGITQYTYDSRDMLIRAETPQGVWSAEYDAFGRRTRKTWQGRTTELHWFGDQLIADTGPDGSLRLYVYADALALTPLLLIDYDGADAPPESGRVGAIICDQLGAPVLVEGPHGEALWQARIAPFGAAEVSPRSRIALALRFPGHYADTELGLHYNRFRHYSPTLGRYLQSDPWGIGGGTNVYAYRTNPLLQVDARGLGEEADGTRRPHCDLSDEELSHAISQTPKNDDPASPANTLRYERYRREGGAKDFDHWMGSSRGGRPGGPEHQADVARNNIPNNLDPDAIVGSRVPDGAGQPGQVVTIRGERVDPGPGNRVLVESEHFGANGHMDAEGRRQVRDMREAEPKSTIVVTDPGNPDARPVVYPPGTQPPPVAPGRPIQPGDPQKVPYP